MHTYTHTQYTQIYIHKCTHTGKSSVTQDNPGQWDVWNTGDLAKTLCKMPPWQSSVLRAITGVKKSSEQFLGLHRSLEDFYFFYPSFLLMAFNHKPDYTSLIKERSPWSIVVPWISLPQLCHLQFNLWNPWAWPFQQQVMRIALLPPKHLAINPTLPSLNSHRADVGN